MDWFTCWAKFSQTHPDPVALIAKQHPASIAASSSTWASVERLKLPSYKLLSFASLGSKHGRRQKKVPRFREISKMND
jgi:hypothetical protein